MWVGVMWRILSLKALRVWQNLSLPHPQILATVSWHPRKRISQKSHLLFHPSSIWVFSTHRTRKKVVHGPST
ncbi:hypothetical protein E2562_000033 [Oryza meyeriana var. granulata]|uniref:Secreted protein n=1 Tax=Oryza meyeriana var. granulata TaxID=110450 RepID=A0A6G1DD78_9ORYZ|nr:hypothetical protein E2562_000033 [Oryza meyeriana var. granulata]